MPDPGGRGFDLQWRAATVATVDGIGYPCDEMETGPDPGAFQRSAPGGVPETPTTAPDAVTSLQATANGFNSLVITGFTSVPLPTPPSTVPGAGPQGTTSSAAAWPMQAHAMSRLANVVEKKR
jgi:hypothetical protein